MKKKLFLLRLGTKGTTIIIWTTLNWEAITANWEDISDNWEG